MNENRFEAEEPVNRNCNYEISNTPKPENLNYEIRAFGLDITNESSDIDFTKTTIEEAGRLLLEKINNSIENASQNFELAPVDEAGFPTI